MKKTKQPLDDDELIMLAVQATRRNDPKQATAYLERALALAPHNARAYQLLAGIHASAGQFDQAIQELTRAVELDPGLHDASYQLGLMHITSGRISEAMTAWKPLQNLGEKHPLFLFQRGMLHLVRNEFAECVTDIRNGIENNPDNPQMNNNMFKIVAKAERAM